MLCVGGDMVFFVRRTPRRHHRSRGSIMSTRTYEVALPNGEVATRRTG